MRSIFMPKPTSPDLQSQALAKPEPRDQLKIVGKTLAVAALAVAILAASIALTFFGAGLILSPFFQGASFELFVSWLHYTTATACIAGPLVSIYPIHRLATPLLSQKSK